MKKLYFNNSEVIFITLMVVANIGIDILISPALIALTTHIVAGLLLMLPINFIFIGIIRFSIDRFGTLTLYMTLFGLICSPLTFWGTAPGIWKIGLGFLIGIILDLIFSIKINTILKITLAGITGSIFWWIFTFSIWQALGLPSVLGFSSMLSAASPAYNGSIDLSNVLNLPITQFGPDLIYFAILCGLISAGPVILALSFAHRIFLKIEKSAVYERFSQIEEE